MLKLDTIEELQSLVSNQVMESSSLEYKAAPAVAQVNKDEIARDVSAMANADGGQIIYGMAEANHLPTGLDTGIDQKLFDGLWFEQVIQQNTKPPVEGLKILQLPLETTGKCLTIVTVPKSRTVHQAKNGRYYRRRNFRIDIMEDYEIREAMARNTNPEVYVRIQMLPEPFPLVYQPGSEFSNPVTLSFHIGNRSASPALYSFVAVHVDDRLKITSTGVFQGPLKQVTETGEIDLYTKIIAVPNHLPIFKELMFALNDRAFHVAVPKCPSGHRVVYEIKTLIRTPGYSTDERWELVQLNDNVSLQKK